MDRVRQEHLADDGGLPLVLRVGSWIAGPKMAYDLVQSDLVGGVESLRRATVVERLALRAERYRVLLR